MFRGVLPHKTSDHSLWHLGGFRPLESHYKHYWKQDDRLVSEVVLVH